MNNNNDHNQQLSKGKTTRSGHAVSRDRVVCRRDARDRTSFVCAFTRFDFPSGASHPENNNTRVWLFSRFFFPSFVFSTEYIDNVCCGYDTRRGRGRRGSSCTTTTVVRVRVDKTKPSTPWSMCSPWIPFRAVRLTDCATAHYTLPHTSRPCRDTPFLFDRRILAVRQRPSAVGTSPTRTVFCL